tara:strand:- start:1118 stop:1315 length:198 start_codon:yes stop_codon:yes gene_type:complete
MKEVLGIICFIFGCLLLIASKDYQYFGVLPELEIATFLIKVLLMMMGFIIIFCGFYLVVAENREG